MLKVVTNERVEFNLEDLLRSGVREMLATALEAEVSEYIEKFKTEVDDEGHRLVVRHGYGKSRTITTSVGNLGPQGERQTGWGKVYLKSLATLPPQVGQS